MENFVMEIWDAYKADGSLAGSDLIRGEKIPEGLLHGVSEIFVLHDDGTILLTQRDYNRTIRKWGRWKHS
jgi:8-oxo-dGTP diphosphatase